MRLTDADHVLLAFEGPLCGVLPRRAMAARLRILLAEAELPVPVRRTIDPLTVLSHARTFGPSTARAVEQQLSALETEAVMARRPPEDARRALAALRAKGTVVTVVGSVSADAIRGFLLLHDLLAPVRQISARRGPDVTLLPPSPFLPAAAVRHRGLPLSACVFVGTRRQDRRAARSAGLRVVAYGRSRTESWPDLLDLDAPTVFPVPASPASPAIS